jgi:CDP-glycerol glycerophosphotransferase (TagB/SpsB family)
MINPIIKYLSEDDYEIILETKNKDTKLWCHEINSNAFDVGFHTGVTQKHSLFICHGAADKGYRNFYNLKNFDYMAVTGSLWVERLHSMGIDKSKLILTGYPKLDPIFQNRNKPVNNTGKINVLYAPTHNMNLNNLSAVSSFPRFMPDIEKLYGDFNIKISNHPANTDDKDITFDDLLWADVVVSDSSSLLYESWSLDIPVVFPDYIVKNNILKTFRNTLEDKIYTEGIGYHANNIEHVKELIYKAKENGLDNKTQEFIEGILPRSLRGKSGQIIADLLLKWCHG